MSHYDDDPASVREALNRLTALSDCFLLRSTFLPSAFRYQDLTREIDRSLIWFHSRGIPLTMIYPRVYIGIPPTANNALGADRPTAQEIEKKLKELNAIWKNPEATMEQKIPIFLWWRTRAISVALEIDHSTEQWRISTWLEPKLELRHYAHGLLGRLAQHLGTAREMLTLEKGGDMEGQMKLWLQKLDILEVELSLNGVLP